MRFSTVLPLLVVTCLSLPLLEPVHGQQQPADLMCYACTYREVGPAVVGKFCNDPFNSALSANLTCDSMCVKRKTTGGVEQVKRACFSDLGESGQCETYYGREVPGSDPPETMTQICCQESFCNHGNINTSCLSLLVITVLGIILMKCLA